MHWRRDRRCSRRMPAGRGPRREHAPSSRRRRWGCFPTPPRALLTLLRGCEGSAGVGDFACIAHGETAAAQRYDSFASCAARTPDCGRHLDRARARDGGHDCAGHSSKESHPDRVHVCESESSSESCAPTSALPTVAQHHASSSMPSTHDAGNSLVPIQSKLHHIMRSVLRLRVPIALLLSTRSVFSNTMSSVSISAAGTSASVASEAHAAGALSECLRCRRASLI